MTTKTPTMIPPGPCATSYAKSLSAAPQVRTGSMLHRDFRDVNYLQSVKCLSLPNKNFNPYCLPPRMLPMPETAKNWFLLHTPTQMMLAPNPCPRIHPSRTPSKRISVIPKGPTPSPKKIRFYVPPMLLLHQNYANPLKDREQPFPM